MDCALCLQFLVAVDDMLEDFGGVLLLKGLVLLQQRSQIALVAEFSNNLGVVVRVEHIVQLQDVGVVKLLHCVDLIQQQRHLHLVFYELHFDHLHGNYFVVLFVFALLDLAGVALADLVVQAVGVVLDDLARHHHLARAVADHHVGTHIRQGHCREFKICWLIIVKGVN